MQRTQEGPGEQAQKRGMKTDILMEIVGKTGLNAQELLTNESQVYIGKGW